MSKNSTLKGCGLCSRALRCELALYESCVVGLAYVHGTLTHTVDAVLRLVAWKDGMCLLTIHSQAFMG